MQDEVSAEGHENHKHLRYALSKVQRFIIGGGEVIVQLSIQA